MQHDNSWELEANVIKNDNTKHLHNSNVEKFKYILIFSRKNKHT